MIFELSQNRINVLLAEVSLEMKKVKQILISILESAGMTVFQLSNNQNLEEQIKNTDCSIHLIGNIFHKNSEEQIEQVRKLSENNTNYKIFIWQPVEKFEINIDERQENLIKNIRNNIFRNMIFAQHESPVMFVEDIRTMMQDDIKSDFDIKETEIFLIFNEIDEDSVENFSELLEDIGEIKKMNIILSKSVDYAEHAAQQMKKSKLSIIYFKRSSNWAIPFTQQIWKKIGGVSADVKILLIGDSNHEQNTKINFKAPNVDFLTVSEELIPLEIKVQFDKISEY